MKRLIDLLKEVSEDPRKFSELYKDGGLLSGFKTDAFSDPIYDKYKDDITKDDEKTSSITKAAPGEIINGVRTNSKPDQYGNYRTNKIGGSLPPEWKDRKAGVDFEPKQRLINIRKDYEDKMAKMKKLDASFKPLNGDWGLGNYVIMFPDSNDVLKNPMKYLEEVRDALEYFMKKRIESGKYKRELSKEELQKILNSPEVGKEGFIYWYGPKDLSKNLIPGNLVKSEVGGLARWLMLKFPKSGKKDILVEPASYANDPKYANRKADISDEEPDYEADK